MELYSTLVKYVVHEQPDWTRLICGRSTTRRRRLTAAVLGLPLQTLSVGEGDDVGRRVDAALRAAAPHALHGLTGAVGAAGALGARRLTGTGALVLQVP